MGDPRGIMWPWRARRRPPLPEAVARPRHGRPGWQDPRGPEEHLAYKAAVVAWLLPRADDPLRGWLLAHPDRFNCSVLYFIQAHGSRAAREALPELEHPEFASDDRYLYVVPEHPRLQGTPVDCRCDFGSPDSPYGIYAGRRYMINTGEGICRIDLYG